MEILGASYAEATASLAMRRLIRDGACEGGMLHACVVVVCAGMTTRYSTAGIAGL